MILLMSTAKTARTIAVAESILVTGIAGSTLVFGKIALNNIGPLTLTGVRYFLAFLLLLPFMIYHSDVTHLAPQLWLHFLLMGVSFYAIGNGAIFWGLKDIPATPLCSRGS